MDFLKTIILAIQQGITELLPISSTAHLILTSKILNFEIDTYLLSVLHLGTTLALLIHFKNTLSKELFKKENLSFWLKILISTIPAGIVGLLFQSFIEERLRSTLVIVFSLLVWGIVMIVIEKKEINESKLKQISWKQSLAMGVSQSVALIPGTSRSGITTIVGMYLGIDKYTAIQYSFLLGLPLLLASSIYGMSMDGIFGVQLITDLLAIIVAGIFTFVSLKILQKYSKKKWLTFFGIYRILLALAILIIYILR